MLLPQLLRFRRQSLHQFLHNLDRLKVDTAPVKVLVVVVASVDPEVDVVDVVDAGDEADVVDEVDVAGVALALYAAEKIVRTHHILVAVQSVARFEGSAFRGCQTLP